METNMIKKLLSVILLFVLLPTALFAKWGLIPLDQLVADTDLIVVGTLHSATENSEGVGEGYILVDKIIAKDDSTTEGQKTLDGQRLKPADNLKLTWEDNWSCASGMHRGWEGKKGIWLLIIQKDGTVTAGYPGRFRNVEDLDKILLLLSHKQTNKVQPVIISRDTSQIDPPAAHDPEDTKPIDTTPFRENSPFGALIVLILSSGLYWILYKSRFRIR
jgi:hypothetical protein